MEPVTPRPARMALRTDREGIALLVVLLLTMVIAAIAAGAALIGANSFLISEYDQRISLLESVADAGLELGRARLNGEPGLFPADSGFTALESGAAVLDAGGDTIVGVTRSIYVGPIGGGAGQYGSYGMVVAVAEDADGVRTVRRQDLVQSSFAQYAYFTDYEPTEISFGSNDQLYGPVHSNSNIKIRSTGATFHGPVTTSGVFEGAEYAVFKDDSASGVVKTLMPTSAHMSGLKSRAEPGHLALTGSTAGTAAQSGMRLDFVARDVDGDGVREGFVRVYRSSDPVWVSGHVPSSGMLSATNCGHFHSDNKFYSHVGDNSTQLSALKSSSRRCYLGGNDSIFGGTFTATDAKGAWQKYPGTVHAAVASQPDGEYLFPLDRRFNPGFRGVIHVEGKVVVSGTVRGRVTLAATNNIIIGDDVRYQTDPGSATCNDMLGLFSGAQIIVADNMLNAPKQPANNEAYYTYDDTPDEFVHASLLALDQITVENHSSGSTSAEPCEGASRGRGCLYVTGGMIQKTRGPIGTSLGTGYSKRYAYDTCALNSPPPYFPTTGRFWKSRYYEVDPTGFSVTDYFRALN